MVGFVWGEVVTGRLFVQHVVLLLANYEVIVQSMRKDQQSWKSSKYLGAIDGNRI